MDCVSRLLRAAMRRWPGLRRSRRWWFRPAHESVTMAIQVLALSWLIRPEPASDPFAAEIDGANFLRADITRTSR